MKHKEGDIVYLRPWEELNKQKGFRRTELSPGLVFFDDTCGCIDRDNYEHFFGKPLTVTAYSEDDTYEVSMCYRVATADGYIWWFGASYIQPVQKKIKYFNRRG